MYVPPAFREDRLEVLHRLISDYPLGLLVTQFDGVVHADPLPFLVDSDASASGNLRCHLSRANPHVQVLAKACECLVVFQGPQAYVTPSWYETKRQTGRVVPTWNYTIVQAVGRPRLIEDAEWIQVQIQDLTKHMENSRQEPWAVGDAPADFVAAQINGIIGLEIVITTIEGKWKVSQNRPVEDRLGVAAGLRHESSAGSPMADFVDP